MNSTIPKTADCEQESDEPTRPDVCTCRSTNVDLPCWECYFAGFDEPAEWSVEVGDRVRADWTEGEGRYDEIVGVVVETAGDLICVNVDQDDDCDGGDSIRFGKHDCSPEWIEEIIEPNAYSPADLDEDDEDLKGPEELIEDDAETVTEEELDKTTLRALDASRPLDVSKMAPEMYEVESENDVYTVDLKEDRCTCKGFMYHGHCRHIRRVEIMTGEYRLPAQPEQLEIDADPSMGNKIEPKIKVRL